MEQFLIEEGTDLCLYIRVYLLFMPQVVCEVRQRIVTLGLICSMMEQIRVRLYLLFSATCHFRCLADKLKLFGGHGRVQLDPLRLEDLAEIGVSHSVGPGDLHLTVRGRTRQGDSLKQFAPFSVVADLLQEAQCLALLENSFFPLSDGLF